MTHEELNEYEWYRDLPNAFKAAIEQAHYYARINRDAHMRTEYLVAGREIDAMFNVIYLLSLQRCEEENYKKERKVKSEDATPTEYTEKDFISLKPETDYAGTVMFHAHLMAENLLKEHLQREHQRKQRR